MASYESAPVTMAVLDAQLGKLREEFTAAASAAPKKVKEPRPKRELTPEALAVLKERLAKARESKAAKRKAAQGA